MTSWSCHFRVTGQHVHCRLLAGPSEHARASVGTLIMRREEFLSFATTPRVLDIIFPPDAGDAETLQMASELESLWQALDRAKSAPAAFRNDSEPS